MLTLRVTRRSQSQHQENKVLFIFGSHTFVPLGWSLKTKTGVSHSSVEAEVMSLDAGLRLGGIPALSLWCILIYVSEPQAQCDLMRHSKNKTQTSRNNSVKQ